MASRGSMISNVPDLAEGRNWVLGGVSMGANRNRGGRPSRRSAVKSRNAFFFLFFYDFLPTVLSYFSVFSFSQGGHPGRALARLHRPSLTRKRAPCIVQGDVYEYIDIYLSRREHRRVSPEAASHEKTTHTQRQLFMITRSRPLKA